VILELSRGRISSWERPRLERQLRLAPWCWPPSGHALEPFARSVSGWHGPEPLPPGVAPGVTVWNQHSATLWRLDMRDSCGPSEATLDMSAQESWSDAISALPRSLPLLWESVRAAAAHPPAAYRIAPWVQAGTAPMETVISGPSLGLTLALLVASSIFNTSLPDDLVASAAIDVNGNVLPVNGIDLKARALGALAPRVKRLMVAVDQFADEEDKDMEVPDSLQVIRVRSVSQAVTVAFESKLEDLLIRAGADPGLRAALVRSFLRLALTGRDANLAWTPLERAADRARQSWPDLSEGERFSLGFAEAVAARHDRNAGSVPSPPAAWLDAQPLVVRVRVATHLVQQAADTGDPSAETARSWVARYAAIDPREAFPDQLRLLGAEARLWAVTGRHRDALARQEAIAGAWWDAFDAASMSFQLSEWFRLSGACGDRESFERADALYAEVSGVIGLPGYGNLYVRLARTKGAIRLQARPPEELIEALLALHDRRVPDELRFSAARWLAHLAMSTGIPIDQVHPSSELQQSDAHGARTQRALRTLDDRNVGVERQDAALSALLELHPGPTIQLRDSAIRLGEDPRTYVAAFFPY
jgi:hypothetical protein